MPIQKNQGTDNIPALRFPEFEGEWVKKRLGDLGNFLGGGTPDSSIKEFWNGDVPWISSSDLKEDTVQDIDITRFITKEAIEKSATKVVPKNSILMVSRVGLGKFAVAKQDLCTSQDFTNFVTTENSYFLAYYFKARATRFVRLSQGTSIKGFTGKDIKSSYFLIPSLPEQQKIASFLTAVDKRISLLKEKKAKLEQYKKGVMQQLFSQQIRFKDDNGQDFPVWEPTTFGSIYAFKTTNSFSRDKLNYDSGTVKNIHYGDIHTKFSSHFDITKEPVPYINSDVDLDRIADENYVQEGDLVIADASEDYADIGKAIEVVNLNGESVLAGLHTFLARRNNNHLIIGFSGHLMKSHSIRLEIMKIAQGTKVLGISTKRLADVPLLLPCKEEQQKIASFLSSLDEQIAQVGQQIEQMSTWKKGLLQKMFV